MFYIAPTNFYQVTIPTDYHLVATKDSENQTNPEKTNIAKIPEVDNALRSFMGSIPSLRFSRHNLTAQTGEIKPDRTSVPQSTPQTIPQLPPTGELVNVIADRQEYNAKDQIFTATGNVTVKYLNTELKADAVKLNLITKDATAEGNVFLQRGDQRLRGSTLSYNYGNSKGAFTNASGFLDSNNLSSKVTRLPSDLRSRSSIISVFGDSSLESKAISRVRFQAEKIFLDGDTWTAENIKVTNDPFDPPELEIRANKATLTKITPTQDRLDTESPALVFDQGLTLPIPFNSIVLDRFDRAFPARIGFDRRDGGGFFYQQNFDAYSKPDINFQISPQIFLQKGLEGNFLDANILGVAAKLDAVLPESQFFTGRATVSGLNLAKLENQLRANLQYSRPVLGNHALVAQYAYRDRLFNGSLGFQDVSNSLGLSLFSPNYVLGDSGINFSYQVGAQYIGAESDRSDSQPIAVASLARLQGATALSRSFPLWRGTALPAERETGLKYLPEPVTPSLDAFVGVGGNYAFYSSGDYQSYLSATVGVTGVFGNFSQPFFDFTKINISYTQGMVGGRSPFLFDRLVDPQTFTLGIVQQIYGPFRLGIDRSWNLVSGSTVDSNYSLQYDRRTYAIVIRYNPTREIGELFFRISDFNWNDTGNSSSSDVTPVTGGLERR